MKLLMNRVATVLVLAGVMAGALPALGASTTLVPVKTCIDLRNNPETSEYFDATFGNLSQCVFQFRQLPVDWCQELKADDVAWQGYVDLYQWGNLGDCIVAVTPH
jgi:hypothetical protein